MGAYKIFLDTETTGLSPAKHQILTIGMIITDENLKPVFEKEYLVRKEEWSEVNPFALRVNKINLSEHNVRAKPEKAVCREIVKDIKKVVRKSPDIEAVGHNLRFDMNFLGAMFERNDVGFPFPYDYEDTMQMARMLIRERKLPLKSSRLKAVCRCVGYEGDGFHNALEDVKATMHIYPRLKKLIEE
ncbi:MAG: 3'-5' exonuclease [Candidatus Micrarchaeota archaeon]|nr:3'-5' exonuclease [Candidatus Micrarchaeota archaeon]